MDRLRVLCRRVGFRSSFLLREVVVGRFYDLVPRTLEENIQFRLDLREKAKGRPKVQQAIREACEEDVLYFFGAWLWVYEPRGQNGVRMLPFVPWPHQESAIITMDEVLTETSNRGIQKDVRVTKGRGEGFSWIGMGLGARDWLLRPMTKVGLVSRNQDMSDSDDSDSLMWKLDFLLKNLPQWWMPKGFSWNKHRSKSDHTLTNPENGSSVKGHSATGNVATGGRTTWFFFDELAKWERGADQDAMNSTGPVTNCRIIGSSPFGDSGAFYDLIHEQSGSPLVRLHWSDNPTKNRGIYRYLSGKCLPMDPVNNPLSIDYQRLNGELFARLESKGFKLEGTLRSPWLDLECDRPGATPQSIAQEYELSFGGSVEKAFGESFVEKSRTTVRQCYRRCNFRALPDIPQWYLDDSTTGNLKLWLRTDRLDQVPPAHKFVIGVDVSAGTAGSYSSNSVACIIDETVGKQVGEMVSNSIPPTAWADMVYCLALWFNTARVIWEKNGPGGQTFTDHFLQYRYPHMYHRQRRSGKGARKRTILEPGWSTPAANGLTSQFQQLQRAVLLGELEVTSKELVEECLQYEWSSPSKISHVGQNVGASNSSRGAAHGDRVVAAALAWHDILERRVHVSKTSQEENDTMFDMHTPEGRNAFFEEESRRRADDWGDPLSGYLVQDWVD